MRLFATFMVVVGHSTYLVISTAYGGIDYSLINNDSSVYTSLLFAAQYSGGFVYKFHMPLFFMLSGAVYAFGKKNSFDRLVRKKTIHLLLPYYLYGWFFMLPVKYLGNFYTADGLKVAMTGFLKGMEAGHLWFLPALFWCFLIFYGLEKYIAKKSLYLMLLIAYLLQTYHFFINIDILHFSEGMDYIFWFSLGWFFSRTELPEKIGGKKYALISGGISTMLVIVNQRLVLLDGFFTIVIYSFWAWNLMELVNLYLPKLKNTRVFKILLENSFAIYIFHDPLEYLVIRLAFHYRMLETSVGCNLYIVMRVLGVMIAAILINQVLIMIRSLFLKNK